MALTTKIVSRITATLTSALDLVTSEAPLVYQKTDDLATGTGASQADKIYSDTITIALSSNTSIDLAGVLTDAFGAALTFVKVKAILICAAAANTNSVQFKPHAANGFLGPFNAAADQLTVPPGGTVLLTAPVSGWAVGAGATDIMYFANSGAGTGVTFDLVIIGTSA
jgi:hypothetical protein